MSLVGPRPNVERETRMYTPMEKRSTERAPRGLRTMRRSCSRTRVRSSEVTSILISHTTNSSVPTRASWASFTSSAAVLSSDLKLIWLTVVCHGVA